MALLVRVDNVDINQKNRFIITYTVYDNLSKSDLQSKQLEIANKTDFLTWIKSFENFDEGQLIKMQLYNWFNNDGTATDYTKVKGKFLGIDYSTLDFIKK